MSTITAFIAILLFTSPRGIEGESGYSQLALFGLLVVVFLVSAATGYATWNRRVRLGFITYLIIAFLVIIVSSVILANKMENAFAGAGIAGLALILGFSVGFLMDLKHSASLVSLTCFAACGISVALFLLNPAEAVVSDVYQAGAFKGIYQHRNQLAFVAALGLVTAVFKAMTAAVARPVFILMIPIFVSIVWLTNSATAILVCSACAGFALFLLIWNFSRTGTRALYLVIFLMGVSLMVAFFGLTERFVLSNVDRESDLTGRDVIWAEVANVISERPFFGYGWGSVWGDYDAVQIAISSGMGFRVYHSHSGYLDLALQLGVIGCAVLMTLFIVLIGIVGFSKRISNCRFSIVSFVLLNTAFLGIYSYAEPGITTTLGLCLIGLLAGSVERLLGLGTGPVRDGVATSS